MSRVLLVEDHARLAALVAASLSAAGVAVDTLERMALARAALQQHEYAALVLDRGLPDGDGLSLLRELRARGERLPCLMLTARDALHDRVDGLESGADDYLAKPFAMDELVARVRALLRRPATAWQPLSPSFGDVSLRVDAGEIVCGSESILLAAAELQVLLLLVRRGGETVRRAALEAAAWGFAEAVTPSAFDVAMHRLRRKLAAIGSTLEIVNVRGKGYALRQTEMGR
ncbi:response regulator transcription factor [Eleftheria terrae]|uniref:response regulator transcription factor n=1 Tax=Eleftheria terrae TaxID=1597781 RepID=UPI00263AC8D6|nr:response regulator transcription factor [Eleftheria terrae]WKB55761.1 response regulator transcription factor [Eleftheria terrae]